MPHVSSGPNRPFQGDRVPASLRFTPLTRYLNGSVRLRKALRHDR